MRTLLLFRGAPGCGKSTYIKEHNLEQHVLSADTLRLMCQSVQETPAGQMEISPQNDDVVWEMLFKLLEVRMSHGEFTVIDATNSKTVEMNRYKNLAKQYRYRMYVIDMTDLPIEECKRRNARRERLKRVPEAVIDKMYARFATQKVPSGVTVLPSTTDVMSDLNYYPNDFNQWKKVHGLYKTEPYIKNKGLVYVGEAEKSVMQMWNMDVCNCVATGGKKVSQNQIEILTRLCVDICFVFDKDVQLSELMVLANRFVDGVSVYAVVDDKGILDEKEAPTDNPEKFKACLLERIRVTDKGL